MPSAHLTKKRKININIVKMRVEAQHKAHVTDMEPYSASQPNVRHIPQEDLCNPEKYKLTMQNQINR